MWILGAILALGVSVGCAKKQATGSEEPTQTQETTPPPEPPSTTPTEPEPIQTGGSVQDVYFDYDRYEIRSDARATLQENANMLKGSGAVTLEGHCDERGTDEYNLALGQRRADAVKAYLVDLGVDGGSLKTVSYGEAKPFADGHDESAWSQNRRVHFITP
jgi:peptidoglycan-associated lipoprotein